MSREAAGKPVDLLALLLLILTSHARWLVSITTSQPALSDQVEWAHVSQYEVTSTGQSME